eukprot:scaffold1234_cov248-Pinguiococcus_pyrenoidosus.AAC.17
MPCARAKRFEREHRLVGRVRGLGRVQVEHGLLRAAVLHRHLQRGTGSVHSLHSPVRHARRVLQKAEELHLPHVAAQGRSEAVPMHGRPAGKQGGALALQRPEPDVRVCVHRLRRLCPQLRRVHGSHGASVHAVYGPGVGHVVGDSQRLWHPGGEQAREGAAVVALGAVGGLCVRPDCLGVHLLRRNGRHGRGRQFLVDLLGDQRRHGRGRWRCRLEDEAVLAGGWLPPDLQRPLHAAEHRGAGGRAQGPELRVLGAPARPVSLPCHQPFRGDEQGRPRAAGVGNLHRPGRDLLGRELRDLQLPRCGTRQLVPRLVDLAWRVGFPVSCPARSRRNRASSPR